MFGSDFSLSSTSGYEYMQTAPAVSPQEVKVGVEMLQQGAPVMTKTQKKIETSNNLGLFAGTQQAEVLFDAGSAAAREVLFRAENTPINFSNIVGKTASSAAYVYGLRDPIHGIAQKVIGDTVDLSDDASMAADLFDATAKSLTIHGSMMVMEKASDMARGYAASMNPGYAKSILGQANIKAPSVMSTALSVASYFVSDQILDAWQQMQAEKILSEQQ